MNLKQPFSQWVSRHISGLILTLNVGNNNLAFGYLLTQEVVTNINVMRTRRIKGHCVPDGWNPCRSSNATLGGFSMPDTRKINTSLTKRASFAMPPKKSFLNDMTQLHDRT